MLRKRVTQWRSPWCPPSRLLLMLLVAFLCGGCSLGTGTRSAELGSSAGPSESGIAHTEQTDSAWLATEIVIGDLLANIRREGVNSRVSAEPVFLAMRMRHNGKALVAPLAWRNRIVRHFRLAGTCDELEPRSCSAAHAIAVVAVDLTERQGTGMLGSDTLFVIGGWNRYQFHSGDPSYEINSYLVTTALCRDRKAWRVCGHSGESYSLGVGSS